MDDLEYRAELLRKILAEPISAPKEITSPDELYQWLNARLEQYKQRKREGSNDAEMD